MKKMLWCPYWYREYGVPRPRPTTDSQNAGSKSK